MGREEGAGALGRERTFGATGGQDDVGGGRQHGVSSALWTLVKHGKGGRADEQLQTAVSTRMPANHEIKYVSIIIFTSLLSKAH